MRILAQIMPTKQIIERQASILGDHIRPPGSVPRQAALLLDLKQVLDMQAGRIYVCGMGDSGQLGLGEPCDDGSPDDPPDEVSIPIISQLPNLPAASVTPLNTYFLPLCSTSFHPKILRSTWQEDALK